MKEEFLKTHIINKNEWWDRPSLLAVKSVRMQPVHSPLSTSGVSGLVGLLMEVRNRLGPGPHKMVELGSWAGESASIWAGSRLFSSIDLIDLWKNPANEGLCEFRTRRFKGVVKMRQADMFSAVEEYEDESLDFLYLDADHSLEGTRKALALWSEKVKPNGIIAGHDWNEKQWPGVVQGVSEFFSNWEPMLFEDTSWLYTKSGK